MYQRSEIVAKESTLLDTFLVDEEGQRVIRLLAETGQYIELVQSPPMMGHRWIYYLGGAGLVVTQEARGLWTVFNNSPSVAPKPEPSTAEEVADDAFFSGVPMTEVINHIRHWYEANTCT